MFVGLLLLYGITCNAQWQSSFPCGKIIAIKSSTNFLCVSTEGGGVFTTTDYGNSWIQLTTTLENSVVTCFEIKDSIIYAGTDHGRMFESNVNGTYWRDISSGIKKNRSIVNTIIVGNIIYAATSDSGVFKKNLKDTDWTEYNTGFNKNITVFTYDNNTLYLGCDLFGVFKRRIGDTSWTHYTVSTDYFKKCLADLDVIGDTMFVSTCAGLLKSVDGGQTWKEINIGLNLFQHPQQYQIIDHYVWVGTIGKFPVSCDSCSLEFEPLDVPGSETDFVRLNNKYFFGSSDGVYRRDANSPTWELLSNGLINLSVIKFASNESTIFAATGAGLFKSSDGKKWISIQNGINSPQTNDLLISGSSIYAGTLGSGVYKSTNNGASWTQLNIDMMNNDVTCLAKLDNAIFAGTNYGIFKTEDDGTTWTFLNNGLEAVGIDCMTIINNSIIIATHGAGLYKSENAGLSWSSVGRDSVNGAILSMKAIGNYIFLGTTNGIYQSNNMGVTWEKAKATYSSSYVVDFVGVGNTVFSASNTNGVVSTEDNGYSWKKRYQGLLDKYVTSFGIFKNNLLVSTAHCGILYQPISTANVESNYIIPSFSISPNPCYTDAILDLRTLKLDNNINIEVYNFNGDKVFTQGLSDFSNSEVSLNLSSLSNGMYNVIIKSGANVYQSKLIKMK